MVNFSLVTFYIWFYVQYQGPHNGAIAESAECPSAIAWHSDGAPVCGSGLNTLAWINSASPIWYLTWNTLPATTYWVNLTGTNLAYSLPALPWTIS